MVKKQFTALLILLAVLVSACSEANKDKNSDTREAMNETNKALYPETFPESYQNFRDLFPDLPLPYKFSPPASPQQISDQMITDFINEEFTNNEEEAALTYIESVGKVFTQNGFSIFLYRIGIKEMKEYEIRLAVYDHSGNRKSEVNLLKVNAKGDPDAMLTISEEGKIMIDRITPIKRREVYLINDLGEFVSE